MINIEPLFFRKDIYATACIAGGVAFWLMREIGYNDVIQQLVCAFVVIGLRICAIRYNWALPQLRYDKDKHNHNHNHEN